MVFLLPHPFYRTIFIKLNYYVNPFVHFTASPEKSLNYCGIAARTGNISLPAGRQAKM
jgi:hypothetical protein